MSFLSAVAKPLLGARLPQQVHNKVIITTAFVMRSWADGAGEAGAFPQHVRLLSQVEESSIAVSSAWMLARHLPRSSGSRSR